MKIFIPRKLNRLKEYDYSQEGVYFVTLITKIRGDILGKVTDRKIELNEYGKIVKYFWHEIEKHYKNVKLGTFVIMPDHIHGILAIEKSKNSCEVIPDIVVRAEQCSALTKVPHIFPQGEKKRRYGLLSKIIKSYKEVVKTIRKKFQDYNFKWARSYYDNIVRNTAELKRIEKYILKNPEKYFISDIMLSNWLYNTEVGR